MSSKASIDGYLSLCNDLRKHGMRNFAKGDHLDQASLRTHLTQARLFHFSEDTQRPLRDTLNAIAEKGPPRDGEAEWALKRCEVFDPTLLPFEYTYFGLGEGIVLQREHPGDAICIYAFLASRNGWVQMFCADVSGVMPSNIFFVTTMRSPAKWVMRTFESVLFVTLFAFVHAHRSYTIENEVDSVTRYDMRKMNRKFGLGLKPRPYYEVLLKDSLVRKVERVIRSNRPAREWAFRWDVRGHERVLLVARPKAPRNVERWKTNGWLTFDENFPVDVQELFRERFIRFPEREWIAIKRVWVSDYVKGPDDAPFVPSIHVDKRSDV